MAAELPTINYDEEMLAAFLQNYSENPECDDMEKKQASRYLQDVLIDRDAVG